MVFDLFGEVRKLVFLQTAASGSDTAYVPGADWQS